MRKNRVEICIFGFRVQAMTLENKISSDKWDILLMKEFIQKNFIFINVETSQKKQAMITI